MPKDRGVVPSKWWCRSCKSPEGRAYWNFADRTPCRQYGLPKNRCFGGTVKPDVPSVSKKQVAKEERMAEQLRQKDELLKRERKQVAELTEAQEERQYHVTQPNTTFQLPHLDHTQEELDVLYPSLVAVDDVPLDDLER